VTPHFIAQPLDFSPELDHLDLDLETDALDGRLGLGLNRRNALRGGAASAADSRRAAASCAKT
jgi:hypothetical protein